MISIITTARNKEYMRDDFRFL